MCDDYEVTVWTAVYGYCQGVARNWSCNGEEVKMSGQEKPNVKFAVEKGIEILSG